ncbi:hypothetical protein BDZ97DRAFT_1807740, partial [Flammula alnicola]
GVHVGWDWTRRTLLGFCCCIMLAGNWSWGWMWTAGGGLAGCWGFWEGRPIIIGG